jgi:probable F420-dependent oxidoreductase
VPDGAFLEIATKPKRPFRFGVGAGGVISRSAFKELARRAESLGFSTLLIPDHFQEQLAPVPALLLAAESTQRLRVGSFVFGNDYRHPAVLAKEAATLDLLTEGRLELGIGAGWLRQEYEQVGLRYDPPAVRVERFEETVKILKGLFADGPFTFSGKYYQITGLENFPKPVQRPHPPILIGGGGRRLLSIAGREADIVGLAPRVPTPERVDPVTATAAATAEKVSWIREAAGQRFEEIEINTYPSLIPAMIRDDRRAAAREVLERLGKQFPAGTPLSEDDVLDSPHIFIGTVDQMVEKMLGLRERFAISYFLIPDDVIDAFAPVVEHLAGK